MTRISTLPDLAPLPRDDDEGLFSRDIDGQLVRLDSPTESDYDKIVTLQIDGHEVRVPLAEPLKDAQGNIVLDIEGRTTPRYTTIFDAASQLYAEKTELKDQPLPIPVLCHQPHMTPVAVCRLCVVQIYGQKRGKRAPERKLLPACQHQVKDGMEVFTMNDKGKDGERVRASVTVLTELLTADHLKDAPAPAPAAELAPFNELQRMAERCELKQSRFKLEVLSSGQWGVGSGQKDAASGPAHCPLPTAHSPSIDRSSPVFLVDHSACILCDRCSRACDEVKNNNVIGRTGKGPTAGIAFDLDTPMGESTCVQCGECMVSCPTSAITFKPVAQVRLSGQSAVGGQSSGQWAVGSGQKDAASGPAHRPPPTAHCTEVLRAAELLREPLFAGVPPKFLLWQEGLAVRRRVKAGDALCHQGDPGNTAFLLRSGSYEIVGWPRQERRRGLLGVLARGKPIVQPLMRIKRTAADFILGEMACLSGTPRSADVLALEEGEVWEIRRNVLDRLMRSPSQQDKFKEIYRSRALESVLRESDLFRGMPADDYKICVEYLRPRLSFVSVSPGQVIFRQGDHSDNFYLIRLGHVRVGIERDGAEVTMLYRGPGTAIGEIGLLAVTPEDAAKGVDAVDQDIAAKLAKAHGPEQIAATLKVGRRSATCTALDHVELARLGRGDFLELLTKFPALRRKLVELSVGRLRGDNDQRPALREYIEQGLYQAQSLLALDLTRCTHCDECTRACIDQHGQSSHGVPITRLLRDGLRFGDHLVATSCRSCKDAYCMIGCPVDSIHRGKHLQIVIEDHCIGCGLCATNCPYGNIWMIDNQNRLLEVDDPDAAGGKSRIAQPKAATCDLCDADGVMDEPKPRCVYACPHDAAHRMTGEELLKKVTR